MGNLLDDYKVSDEKKVLSKSNHMILNSTMILLDII